MNCSQLYLGSTERLDEVASEEFSVELVRSGTKEGQLLRRLLGLPYVYYLAPHTGCGCGWEVLEVGSDWDEKNRGSCFRLGAFLQSAEDACGSLAIYSACIASIGREQDEELSLPSVAFLQRINELRVRYASEQVRVFRLAPNNSSKPTPLRGAA